MRKVLLGLLLFALSVHTAFAVAIVLDDGSTFEVELVAHGAGSYTYQVEEVAGKDLSHWLLEFGVCAEHLVSAEPAEGFTVGVDGSTGRSGAKWDVTDEFTVGTFTFQLDAEYPIGPILALVKTGSGFATAYVDGPLCSVEPPPDDPQDPTPTPTDLPDLCREELPQLEYLGNDTALYTLPDGFDYFIVKRNSPFSFDVLPGPTYDNAAGRRLWACQDGSCQLPAVYHDAVDLGHFDAGATVSLAIIDDDIDDRVNYWAVDDPSAPYQTQEQQGMVVYTSLTVPAAGNWYYYASDSIGLYVTCAQPPTPQPTPTQTTEPPGPEGTPTPTEIPPTVPPTATLAPPATPTIEPPTPTVTATASPTATVPITPTLIPPVTLEPPTATPDNPPPTPTVPPTNEEDGPEPKRWFNWLPIVNNWCDAVTHQFGCGN